MSDAQIWFSLVAGFVVLLVLVGGGFTGDDDE